jgi:hypothetical protein
MKEESSLKRKNRWTQNRCLEGGARYLNFCAHGIKLGFEISDKEKATGLENEFLRKIKEKSTRSYVLTSGDVVSKLRTNGRLNKEHGFIVLL